MNFRGIFNATLGRLILPVSTAPTVPVEGEVWDESHVLKARLDGATVDLLTSADKGADDGICPLVDGLVPEVNLPSSASSAVPTGTVLDFAGVTAPSGYALCNGASLTRAGAYATLFSTLTFQRNITYISTKNYHVSSVEGVAGFYVGMRVEIDGAGDTVATIDTVGNNFTVSTIDSLSAALAIGLPWGAADLVTFKLPDFRRRTTIGAGGTVVNVGTGTVGNAVGQTGGEEQHQLIVSELAAHHHFTTTEGGGGSAGRGENGNNVGPVQSTDTGGDAAHNTMQPSATVNKIIKV